MRVKRGVTTHKRHKKIKQATKGMVKSRRGSYRLGKQAVIRSLQNAYKDRRLRKRDMKKLWIIRINAASRQHDLTYSEFIKLLNDSKIKLNRKSLADLAAEEPKSFEAIVKTLSKQSKLKKLDSL